jgi:hypothetical protein
VIAPGDDGDDEQHKELLQQAWNNPKLQHLSPNVLSFVDRFNVVSGWVSSMIVKVELLRNRVRMMTKIVSIAKVSDAPPLHPMSFAFGLLTCLALLTH